jgi:hypothetical protein
MPRPPTTPQPQATLWRHLDSLAGGRTALALAVGSHRFTLYRVAAGVRPPTADLAARIAAYLTETGTPTSQGEALDLLTGAKRWEPMR